MSLIVRPLTPADYARHIEIENTVAFTPGTVAELKHDIETRRPDLPWVNLVGEVDGRVAGIAYGGAPVWLKPGVMFQKIIVDPASQGQGVGSALFAELERFFAEHRPQEVRSSVRDDMAQSLAWAEKRGFQKRHHIFDSVLELSAFDRARFAGKVEEVLAQGFTFVHFDQVRTPENELRLYDLFNMVIRSVPDAADRHVSAFEDWAKWFLTGHSAWHEGYIIAVDADGNWAGFTSAMKSPEETKEAGIAVTGVQPEFRGKGLALALKVYQTMWLQDRGFQQLKTNNHSANAPMLAVNRKLGYVPKPGQFNMTKPMAY